MTKAQCWEAMHCGRQPGGLRSRTKPVCPAAIAKTCDGTNGGHNGGRVCWAVAGTLCRGRASGTFAEKRITCLSCAFFKLVAIEEGIEFRLAPAGGESNPAPESTGS